MGARLLDTIKWLLIISFGAIIFYVVYPKYQFVGSNVRMSKITGVVERFEAEKQ